MATYSNLTDIGFVDDLYDMLGTVQKGWDGSPYKYTYSHALMAIVNRYFRPGGRENTANFAKKQRLAGIFARVVAAHLKEARAAGMSDAVFFKSKHIAGEYQDTILAIADNGSRSRRTRSRNRNRSRTRRG